MRSCDLAAIFLSSLSGQVKPLNLSYLNDSQNSCSAQLLKIVERFGGALLADPVGSGKTRVAIAVATEFNGSRKICVIAPARIRKHWISEVKKCGFGEVEFYSHTFLSRNENVQPESKFIVVDEAHHFRNPRAKRSVRLKKILEAKPCLLVSATPFVNRERDLRILIRYFLDDADAIKQLGIDPNLENAADLKSLLYNLCVRRAYESLPDLDVVEVPYRLSETEISFMTLLVTTLSDITFEALKYEWPKGLVTQFLLAQLRSGLAALLDSLLSIVSYYEEWLSAAENNLGMNRRFFLDMFPNGQLPLSFMYPALRLGDAAKVKKELHKLRTVLGMLLGIKSYSREEAAIGACLSGERMLIFTSKISVAESLFRRYLKSGFRVGMIHSKRCLLSGIGEVEPSEIISKFREGDEQNKISILVATDCLSEGVSFPRCSNLMLIDIPDTALKIEQRIGRIVRMNSLYDASKVYVLKPTNAVAFADSFSIVSERKSKKSTELGFQYKLAASIFGEKKESGCPFSALLEIRDILKNIDIVNPNRNPILGKQFSVKNSDFDISSLTLVKILEGDDFFSYHWVAMRGGKLVTRWEDIRSSLRCLASLDDMADADIDWVLSKKETHYFEAFINRKNLTRFRPAPERKSDSLSLYIANRVRGFALSSEESQHVADLLRTPFSRAQRLGIQALVGSTNANILAHLLDMEVGRMEKLVYQVVLRIRFIESAIFLKSFRSG